MNEFSRSKIDASVAELKEEKALRERTNLVRQRRGKSYLDRTVFSVANDVTRRTLCAKLRYDPIRST